MKFHVVIREVYIQTVEIEAKNEKDAIEKVETDGGEYLPDTLEYSHTLGSDCWTIFKVSREGGQKS